MIKEKKMSDDDLKTKAKIIAEPLKEKYAEEITKWSDRVETFEKQYYEKEFDFDKTNNIREIISDATSEAEKHRYERLRMMDEFIQTDLFKDFNSAVRSHCAPTISGAPAWLTATPIQPQLNREEKRKKKKKNKKNKK